MKRLPHLDTTCRGQCRDGRRSDRCGGLRLPAAQSWLAATRVLSASTAALSSRRGWRRRSRTLAALEPIELGFRSRYRMLCLPASRCRARDHKADGVVDHFGCLPVPGPGQHPNISVREPRGTPNRRRYPAPTIRGLARRDRSSQLEPRRSTPPGTHPTARQQLACETLTTRVAHGYRVSEPVTEPSPYPNHLRNVSPLHH